ncbi:TPA: hypothetical protein NPN72_004995 [Klebsiella pneumoniae]|nr:Histidine ABC transporter [Klebsiella pneumoniae]HCI6090881.1 hypothetical protein [Klebsiella pneumoniae]
MLHGLGELIFQGALTTLELTLSSAVLAVAIRMLGAAGTLSKTFQW